MAEEKSRPEEEGHGPVPATTSAEAVTDEDLVQLTGRVPKSIRKRVKIAAAMQDISAQDVQLRAIEEYLNRHGY